MASVEAVPRCTYASAHHDTERKRVPTDRKRHSSGARGGSPNRLLGAQRCTPSSAGTGGRCDDGAACGGGTASRRAACCTPCPRTGWRRGGATYEMRAPDATSSHCGLDIAAAPPAHLRCLGARRGGMGRRGQMSVTDYAARALRNGVGTERFAPNLPLPPSTCSARAPPLFSPRRVKRPVCPSCFRMFGVFIIRTAISYLLENRKR
jgi:hypothetical protein